jgi:hypothetical protein
MGMTYMRKWVISENQLTTSKDDKRVDKRAISISTWNKEAEKKQKDRTRPIAALQTNTPKVSVVIQPEDGLHQMSQESTVV